MLGRRHEQARLQSDFYRNSYRRLLSWLMTSVVIMLVLIAANVYVVLTIKPTTYYATTTTGQIIKMAPNE